MVPLILILPVPVMDAFAIVPPLTSGAVNVLLVKVSVASRVTTTPVAGKVAVELRPVPPTEVGKMPVTAAGCDKLSALKDGAPPPLGTVKLWYADPAAVDSRLLPLLPRMTPLLVKLLAPVPPTPTAKTPLVMLAADILGMSAAVNVVPTVTRPLASTSTFG